MGVNKKEDMTMRSLSIEMKRLSFIIFHSSFSVALALLIAGAAFTACSSSSDEIIEQPVNPTEPKVYTMTVTATKGGDDATTRGLSLSGQTLNAKWNEGEVVYVTDTDNNPLGTLTAAASNSGTTTLTGTITYESKPTDLKLYLHNTTFDYRGQKGVLLKPASGEDNSIETNYDYAWIDGVGNGNIIIDEVNKTVSVSVDLNFDSYQSIVKFTLVDRNDNAINPTSLTLSSSGSIWFTSINYLNISESTFGDYELTGLSGTTNEIYVSIGSNNGGDLTLTATTASGDTYTYTKTNGMSAFDLGNYYEIKVKMYPAVEAVDLGLSVKWAPMNVGAISETDRGSYFAWAGTTGYAYESGHDFSKGNCPYYNSGFSKYIGSDYTKLQAEDDAATKNWGSQWRMPTFAEWNELKNNCTAEWKENYKGSGINGILFTSNKTSFTDKSIFLPTNGYYVGTEPYFPTARLNYWSSDYDRTTSSGKYINYFYAYMFDAAYDGNQFYWWRNTESYPEERYYGLGVRAVTK